MYCPNCGALMRLAESLESLRCEYCQSVYTPQPNDEGVRPLGVESQLACPVCAVLLEQAGLASHRILYCSRCQGMLVPMDEFVALIEELRSRHAGAEYVQAPADRTALARHIRCPKCHEPMDTHFYEGPGNVVIDDCSHCFLNWLDEGELMKIVHAPDHLYAEDKLRR
jgi:Zn-finger nucleic acid-binding protein